MNLGEGEVCAELGSRPLRAEGVALRSPALDAQGKKTDPVELISLMQNHVPIDWLVHKKICYLPQSLPVVDNLNGLFAQLRPVSKLVVEVYMAAKASISISIRNYINIKTIDSVKETLTIKQTTITPRE